MIRHVIELAMWPDESPRLFWTLCSRLIGARIRSADRPEEPVELLQCGAAGIRWVTGRSINSTSWDGYVRLWPCPEILAAYLIAENQPFDSAWHEKFRCNRHGRLMAESTY
jgi:hypothetical protein